MKYFLLLALFISFGTLADCSKLSKIADDNSQDYGTKYSYTVQGQKGFRSYFHSAPSNSCKVKDLFLIPKDSVIAYSEFKNENQTWLFVMYVDKNGNDTEGWLKQRDLKLSGSVDPVR
ncbi:hypothetical protein [Acinetobacter soli]|uniref:hypothetical protein n=1 Tax=Acinetobacter soli TaxID=487316 RepID=UPI000B4D0087|nr:hypothetical protein [Acinetobacter soli]